MPAAIAIEREGPRQQISLPGVMFAVIGLAGLILPLVEFKANRLVPGDGVPLHAALGPAAGWGLTLALLAGLLAGVPTALGPAPRLALALAGVLAVILALGGSVGHLTPEGNTIGRVSPAAGLWLLLFAFALMAADALARLGLRLWQRWLLLGLVCLGLGLVLASGWLDGTSVMREYAARSDVFGREAERHLLLAFGSVGMALAVGLPLGIGLYLTPALRRPVLAVLNVIQTIPSLAMFGIMIPVFGWVALNVPGAAALGIAGIGAFPALVALFGYALLPVVSNTVVGLAGVSPEARDAAVGLGMTRPQLLAGVLLPLALPSIIAGIRIVVVQNVGLTVIAGLIGGGGFGAFVFQGLNQRAVDLVLLGAVPAVALALVSGIALGLVVEGLDRTRQPQRAEP